MEKENPKNENKSEQDNKSVINILFACSNNTCRSPMAQAIAQKRLDEKFPGRFQCYSAGAAVDHTGSKPEFVSQEAANAVKDENLGTVPPERIARNIYTVDVKNMDKIYVLNARRLHSIQQQYPDLEDRIELFSTRSIPDPSDLEHFPHDWPCIDNPNKRTKEQISNDYRYVAKKINSYVDRIVDQLEREFISPEKGAAMAR